MHGNNDAFMNALNFFFNVCLIHVSVQGKICKVFKFTTPYLHFTIYHIFRIFRLSKMSDLVVTFFGILGLHSRRTVIYFSWQFLISNG